MTGVQSLLPSLGKEFLDPKSGKPLTGASKGIAHVGGFMGDVRNIQEMNPLSKAATLGDMASGGALTKLVQEDIMGSLNQGMPVRKLGDDEFKASDLFTREGFDLFMDRFNSAKRRNEELKRRKAKAAGGGGTPQSRLR